MKITGIKVKLSELDVLENIKEYVKVDNLIVEKITFDGKINIQCTYKKGIKINLTVKIEINRVSDNILYLNILDVNMSKLHILDSIKNLALKNILKDFKKFGVNVNKNIISVDVATVCNKIPFVKFKLVGLDALNGAIEAEVKDLVITQENEVKEEIEKVEELVHEKQLEPFVKTVDKYTSLRIKTLSKVPDKYFGVAEYAFLIPDILILFGRLLKDKRVPLKEKVVIGSIVAYLASPFDLTILFIPFVGGVSVYALVFYGLSYVCEKLPEQILMENWQGEEKYALKIKGIAELLNKASGGKNIDKLMSFSKLPSIKTFSKR
ncbi:MAG: hypothetical protein H7Y18_14640 [Clostridiaceae bacterium]|nr:hypothetical protein [Clostridiaceae bacterium]